jgi:hypothetical protein
MLRCNKAGCAGLPEDIEGARELGIAERSAGDWRIVASAWLVAILFLVLFAAAAALASLRITSSHEASLAGAVIPRHDPSFPGPNEIAASDWLNRLRAEAYSGW